MISLDITSVKVTCFVIRQMCCFASCICPRDVALDLGRFFLTKSEVSSGYITKWPASITFIQVDRTRLNDALCRKFANLGKVDCTYALFAIYLCEILF